jgi:hypothetical protein
MRALGYRPRELSHPRASFGAIPRETVQLRRRCGMRRVIASVVVASAVLLGVGVVVRAQAMYPGLLGTWKMNVAKSTYNPASAAPKSNGSKWESVEGGYRSITDGVDAQGKATHTEITTKFDGADVPLKGAPVPNTTRAYKRIDDHTWQFVDKVDGKVTTTTRVVMAADGRTRTNTQTGKNAQGQAVNSVQVWEKQ